MHQRVKKPAALRDEVPHLRDWQSARVFLEVARSGSFRAAAQALRESVNTVRRRIDEFERESGTTLFTRHVDGVRLTEEGAALLDAAKRMEQASFDLARLRNPVSALEGEVRLSVTEGLGTFWLTPHLIRYARAHPKLLIELKCEMQPADVLRLESDIAVQITRPTVKDLHMVKLGAMHAMPFAAKRYLDLYGVPKTLADLAGRHIVLQVAEQLNAVAHLERLFPGVSQLGLVPFRTNVSSAHYFAVFCGAGVGVLPTYASVISDQVVPVDIDAMRFHHDIWLAYHPDAVRLPRVRATIDWLIEMFSPKKYPWFANEFIHPRDLPQRVAGLSLFSLFEGLEGVQ